MNDTISFDNLHSFTRCCNYRPTVDWNFLEEQLNRWINERSLARLDIDPDFQRGHVWTTEQQIKYVEYVLQGGTSGRDIYFNCVGWQNTFKGPFVLVDGKQRIQAVREFMANRLPVFAHLHPNNKGLLKADANWNVKGYYRKDIDGRIPHEAYFFFNVNDLGSRAEVLKWYLEMNTGGTPHTDEEINKVKIMLNAEKKV